jgi:GT2 family glycosyltransferase
VEDVTDSGTISPNVAAVIVSFNRRELLRNCLSRVAPQIPDPAYVVVVDNASSDGTQAMLAAEFPVVTLLAMTENLGPAGGFAVGVEWSLQHDADFVWLFNDDNLPVPGALDTLLQRSQLDPRRAVVVGSTWNGESGVFHVGAYWRGGVVWPAEEAYAGVDYEVDLTTFNGLLVPADAFRQAGNVRRDFFIMWEEYEWCLRARTHGWRFVILTEPLLDVRRDEPVGTSYPSWRGYYQARNTLVTVLARKKPRELAWYARRETKLLVSALRLNTPGKRVALRLRGIADGLRGRTGRLIDPPTVQ